VILHQLNLSKLKLEYLKSDFKCKKDRNNRDKKSFASLEFNFFEYEFSSSAQVYF